jgi:hypothetical protein
MSRATKAAAIALSIAFTGITVVTATAETKWERNHPRRDQVNDRLENQNRRINRELREGEITKGEARQLHREDRAIRREERTMSKLNNGHISPRSKKRLISRKTRLADRLADNRVDEKEADMPGKVRQVCFFVPPRRYSIRHP